MPVRYGFHRSGNGSAVLMYMYRVIGLNRRVGISDGFPDTGKIAEVGMYGFQADGDDVDHFTFMNVNALRCIFFTIQGG